MNKYLNEIFQMVTEANSSTFTTFLSFSGHVNGFDIRIYNTGWRDGEEMSYWQTFYLPEVKQATVNKIRKDMQKQMALGADLSSDTEARKKAEVAKLKRRLAELGADDISS